MTDTTNLDLDFKWRYIRYWLRGLFSQRKLPDLNSILMSVGINEIGILQEDYSKEEKQDLMHIGTCAVLVDQGYYEKTHVDDDGWPHYKNLRKIPAAGFQEQENLLKNAVIEYFEKRYDIDYE